MDQPGDFLRRIGGVHAYQWNPLRETDGTPLLLNNFGDLLGPLVVELVHAATMPEARLETPPERRVFSVGSVMHFARARDVVWGTGINGKVTNAGVHKDRKLDVRAVRGPLSAAYMTARGIEVPRVYGDPALLLPDLMPELRAWARVSAVDVLLAPNFNDLVRTPEDTPEEEGAPGVWTPDEAAGQRLLVPTDPLRSVLRTIAQSRFVVGSSLHAVVIADALGIPARFVVSRNESAFKYRDYLAGTGRPLTQVAGSVAEALELGPHEPPVVDLELLLESFPRDVWGVGTRVRRHAGRPIEVATFPEVVTQDLRSGFAGEMTPDEQRTRWLDELVPQAVAAASVADGADPAAHVAVDAAATYRELVVPTATTDDLDADAREVVALVERRDPVRIAVATRVHGTAPRAELRRRRAAADGLVVSLSVQTPRVLGSVEQITLVLVAPDARIEVPVPVSPFHQRQWHVDVDALVRTADLTPAPADGRWAVHVRLTDDAGTHHEVPLAPRGTWGLGLAGAPAADDDATIDPWVLEVAPQAVPA
ncbi:polysaccharide pyruvyl transferase family protein [Cellulomonas sp. DKR-3]|uniref:Polysaccharide pyruvyl transferase family protein n=1 Tax=Cellulomonas fulva TaxID=2835530 RepID=A0ABS5TZL0_9CELL|nr:polysaccharide pyruvyl transferase family protein [Cellulomonas fulva]MBT0994590.1 polysaccharide pyruvyl transferase family protein [Cellulomonas fulva]